MRIAKPKRTLIAVYFWNETEYIALCSFQCKAGEELELLDHVSTGDPEHTGLRGLYEIRGNGWTTLEKRFNRYTHNGMDRLRSHLFHGWLARLFSHMMGNAEQVIDPPSDMTLNKQEWDQIREAVFFAGWLCLHDAVGLPESAQVLEINRAPVEVSLVERPNLDDTASLLPVFSLSTPVTETL